MSIEPLSSDTRDLLMRISTATLTSQLMARGLRNTFSDAYDVVAPLGYPAIHHLTRPLRRAAAAAEDPDGVNLWAGTGFQAVRRAPAADILRSLA